MKVKKRIFLKKSFDVMNQIEFSGSLSIFKRGFLRIRERRDDRVVNKIQRHSQIIFNYNRFWVKYFRHF